MTTSHVETSLHERLRDEQMLNPEFREEYLRAQATIAQVDAIINSLDQLREASGRTKADLAREIGKEPSVVRRLFTAEANPELRTIAALATALDAEIQIVPRRARRARHTQRRAPTAA